MSENEKKEFKDSVKTLAIVIISMLLVVSMNKKCSNMMQKATAAKVKKMNLEKQQIMEMQKVR